MIKSYICYNSTLTDKDELIRGAHTKGNDTFTLIFIISKASTLASASISGLLGRYMDENL